MELKMHSIVLCATILLVAFGVTLQVELTEHFRIKDDFTGSLLTTKTGCKSDISCVYLCYKTAGCQVGKFDKISSTCEFYTNVGTVELSNATTSSSVIFSFRIYKCEDGWIRFNSSCYWIDTSNKRHWSWARNTCSLKGAPLATITSEEELDAVAEMTSVVSDDVWIGAFSQLTSTGLRWVWNTGETWTWDWNLHYGLGYAGFMTSSSDGTIRSQDHALSEYYICETDA